LDTAATAADPDAGGPLESGYDDDFREPVMVAPASGSGLATIRRVEVMTTLPAQIRQPQNMELQMLTGRSTQLQMQLCFHYEDLEDAGLIDSLGRPMIRAPGDRLARVRNPETGDVIEEFPAIPGLYATQVRSSGFGLGPTRNLLIVTFEERAASSPNQ
jgi:hypothetical protein